MALDVAPPPDQRGQGAQSKDAFVEVGFAALLDSLKRARDGSGGLRPALVASWRLLKSLADEPRWGL